MSAAPAAAANPYLATYLAPLRPFLDRPEVTDIFVNRPGEAWVEALDGVCERQLIPALDETALWRLARQIAACASQGISREHPLLSATLPDGARVQVIAPPATRGSVVMAIRKHVLADMSLGQLRDLGVLEAAGPARAAPDGEGPLERLRRLGATEALLREAVRSRRTIVVCGGTSTGKTTFANALIKEIPEPERLVIIEDAPELRIERPNAVGLVAVRGELGEARVTTNDLLEASLRMRPDRIIVGELRGREALSFVRAANTGHPGSITTVHANDPDGALRQIALMMVQAGINLSRADCEDYVRQTVDVWVQLERVEGRRRVSAIELSRSGPTSATAASPAVRN